MAATGSRARPRRLTATAVSRPSVQNSPGSSGISHGNESMNWTRNLLILAVALAACALAGCGESEQEQANNAAARANSPSVTHAIPGQPNAPATVKSGVPAEN